MRACRFLPTTLSTIRTRLHDGDMKQGMQFCEVYQREFAPPRPRTTTANGFEAPSMLKIDDYLGLQPEPLSSRLERHKERLRFHLQFYSSATIKIIVCLEPSIVYLISPVVNDYSNPSKIDISVQRLHSANSLERVSQPDIILNYISRGMVYSSVAGMREPEELT